MGSVRVRCGGGGGGGSGADSQCCSTYLDPRGVARGDQGGGALLHQIGEIGVAREQISVETVAGGGAPPPFPMFLQREREGRGYCAARL